MNYSSKIDQNYLRIEIAISQQPIDIYEPGVCKFKIPALIYDDDITGTMYTNNSNIINKSNIGNTAVSKTTIDDTIELYVPKEYVRYYGQNPVPKGTRFIVAFIGGNINDIKIIGRYDNLEQ